MILSILLLFTLLTLFSDGEHTHSINFLMAAVYGLVGWVMRVAIFYYEYSNIIDKKTPGAKFPLRLWWRIYDKYIILNGVACLGLSLISDWIWHIVDGWFFDEGVEPVFDERVNIIIGFMAISILYFINRKGIQQERDKL